MRQGQQSRRGRGRGRKGQNPLTRNYESNGPDVKIRGTAAHIAEKYVSLARDALAFLWLEMIGGSASVLETRAGIARAGLYRSARRGRARAGDWKRLLNGGPAEGIRDGTSPKGDERRRTAGTSPVRVL